MRGYNLLGTSPLLFEPTTTDVSMTGELGTSAYKTRRLRLLKALFAGHIDNDVQLGETGLTQNRLGLFKSEQIFSLSSYSSETTKKFLRPTSPS